MTKHWDVTPPPDEEPPIHKIIEWMTQAYQLAADYYYPDGEAQKRWYQMQADNFAEASTDFKDRISNEELVKKMFGEQ